MQINTSFSYYSGDGKNVFYEKGNIHVDFIFFLMLESLQLQEKDRIKQQLTSAEKELERRLVVVNNSYYISSQGN